MSTLFPQNGGPHGNVQSLDLLGVPDHALRELPIPEAIKELPSFRSNATTIWNHPDAGEVGLFRLLCNILLTIANT